MNTDKPTIPEVLPLVRAIYTRDRIGAVGCCWHILLDDGNVDDIDVEFCADQARYHKHLDCLALVDPIKRMNKTQRRKLGGLIDRVNW